VLAGVKTAPMYVAYTAGTVTAVAADDRQASTMPRADGPDLISAPCLVSRLHGAASPSPAVDFSAPTHTGVPPGSEQLPSDLPPRVGPGQVSK